MIYGKIKRSYGPKQTTGAFSIYDNGQVIFFCNTVELVWMNNKRLASCIPSGKYKVVKRWSEKYGWHFHILNVPDRDMILIHAANFSRQLKGCIAPGKTLTDIDNDGLQDVTASRDTLAQLISILPETFEIEIS